MLPHLQPIVTPSSIANSAKCFERLVAILVGLEWVRIPRSKADKPNQKIHTQRKNLTFSISNLELLYIKEDDKKSQFKIIQNVQNYPGVQKRTPQNHEVKPKAYNLNNEYEVQKQLPFV